MQGKKKGACMASYFNGQLFVANKKQLKFPTDLCVHSTESRKPYVSCRF